MDDLNPLSTLFTPFAPTDAVKLVVRTDGTFDYRYVDGYAPAVVSCLRQVADKIESGAVIEDSQ